MGWSLLFKDAQVIDGSGAAAFPADVAVEGDRIAAVRPRAGDARGAADLAGALAGTQRPAEPQPPPGCRVVDGSGQCLAPGFIDIHSHADLIFPLPEPGRGRLLAGRIAQGITTEILGNCGIGAAPVTRESEPLLRGINAWLTPETIPWTWRSMADYLGCLERAGVPLNVGTLAPHGPLRIAAMGLAARAAGAAELSAMRAALRRALEEGAFGVSTGLIYPPGIYSDTAECIAMAAEAAACDALYTSHIRGSSELLLPAVEELIEVGRASGARVHHSHSEAVGRPHWPKVAAVLEREDRARAEGVRLTHDMFPYPAAATTMLALFPPWSLEGGVGRFLERLGDPGERRKIRRAVERQEPQWPPWEAGGWPHNLSLAVGWDRISIGSVGSAERRDLEGVTLAELGRRGGTHPFEALCDLLLAEQASVSQIIHDVTGDASHEQGLEAILAHPAGCLCTDANDYGRGKPHPAAYGAFPRALGRYARERRVLSLEETVRKMTSYPAALLGLRDRGMLREGMKADLVLIDPEKVADRGGFDDPRFGPAGIGWVVINGRVAAEAGRTTGVLAGRVLRRGAAG